MPLTDVSVKNAGPKDKAYKLGDSGGLYLFIVPTGGKLWRLDYRFAGKRKTLAIGAYDANPPVSLAAARGKRDDARKLLASGVDPAENRKAMKTAQFESAANSFEVVAREWFGKYSPQWAKSHSEKIISRFERDIFPWIGKRPIAEIKAKELLITVERIEKRGALETAHRALQTCSQVFRYAVRTGRAERDPSGDLRGALPPAKGRNFAAIIDPAGVGKLLRKFDDFKGSFVVLSALRLAPLVFVRPGELRQAKWAEIDLDAGEWSYRVTKTDTDHIVPLAAQAVAILRELHPLTGHRPYVFAGRTPTMPISENTVNAALRRLGYDTQKDMTGHGFRAMARTLLHERLNFAPEVIEHQLAHTVGDTLGTAYNRTKFLEVRKTMMQKWADYLDTLKAADGDKVVPLQRRA